MTTFGTIAALTITTASITDGNGRISTGIDNSTDEFQFIHWFARLKSGGSAPAATGLYELYFFREDDHATEYVTDGETLTDGALSATPENAQPIGSMALTADANKSFYKEGVVENPGPGRWAIGFMNESGQTMSTTEADGFVHWLGEKA